MLAWVHIDDAIATFLMKYPCEENGVSISIFETEVASGDHAVHPEFVDVILDAIGCRIE